ncbi:MAG TPA: asparagine synthase C-terminal domain-containing protein, partial [Burkholderiales bacterium]|nr:asparagine synthase C-terminal domain-containing protein [Burkholderiales bacterium]
FLSGGLDSTLVAAILARRAQCDVHAFTIGFPDPAFDESEPARRIAGHLGIRHTERILSPTEMLDILPRWGELFDEPFGDSSGVPTYLVSSVARESVKVALSADGGDELFSGYHQYGVTLERERVLKRIPRPARVALSQALKLAPFPMLQRVMEGLPAPPSVHHAARRAVFDRLERLAPIMPDVEPAMLYDMGTSSWTRRESERLLGCTAQPRAVLNGHARDLATYMTCCDLRHYLPGDILTKVDRATMAVSLEGREPLLDHRIVEFALRLPLDLKRGALGTKHLLRRILYRYVPRALVERPKRGFSVPLSRWLSGELSTLVDAYLAPARITAGAVFDPAEVERAVRGLRDGGARRDRLDVRKVWLLLAFEMWRERWT